MINKLVLENFQSHKAAVLELHENVNSIIGSSDNGKTAVLRALYWLVQNKPQGTAFVSDWAKKDGKLIDESFVSVTKGKNLIVRCRAENKNDYYSTMLGGDGEIVEYEEIYEALRGSVPPEIKKKLNISEVNIQKQMDSPFLLSSTPGEVARFLNKMIKLDVIDSVLSDADGLKRANKFEIKSAEKLIVDNEVELEKYTWIAAAEKLFYKHEKIEKRFSSISSEYSALGCSVEDFERFSTGLKLVLEILEIEKEIEEYEILYDDVAGQQGEELDLTDFLDGSERLKIIINRVDEVEKVQKDLDEFETLNSDFRLLMEADSRLQDSICNFEIHDGIIASEKDFDRAQLYLERFEKVNERMCETCKEVEYLDGSRCDFIFAENRIKNIDQQLKTLHEELPEICPACGNEIKGGLI